MNNALVRTLRKWFSVPWYPLAFAAYPVLALLAFNAGQVQPGAGLRLVMGSLLFTLLIFLLLRLVLREAYQAAFLTQLVLLLFFTYGHVHDLLAARFPEANITPWLAAAWMGLLLVFIYWATRPRLSFVQPTPGLNLVMLGLLAVSGLQAFTSMPQTGGHRVAAENAPVQELRPPEGEPLPDIYYIILDSYARADLLKLAYGYDNRPFLQALEARGFYVAECSQSNYNRTEISLASSLNMLYLQDLDPLFNPENIGRTRLWDSLRHSAVRYDLESLGYKTVNFENGYAWMELRDADEFISPPAFSAGLTEFEALFLRTTAARLLEEWGWVDPDATAARAARGRFNTVFDSLESLARDPAPTFAYIHILSPHPPFVFGPEGEPTHPADFWNAQRRYPANLYAQGYQNQLTNLNNRLEAGIDVLLENSETPPIIILQGDHGPWLQSKDRLFRVLNAYYLPGRSDTLYPDISPVNTFRLIFNEYFGGQYPLLEDHSYYSPVPRLYDFTEIPNPCEP